MLLLRKKRWTPAFAGVTLRGFVYYFALPQAFMVSPHSELVELRTTKAQSLIPRGARLPLKPSPARGGGLGGGVFLPHAPYHNQHDRLKPPYVDCWRSGDALDCQRLAVRSLILFLFFVWARSSGGGAGDGSTATNGGA
ncbi:hypothetical protein MNBD_ALPHA12-562 [hydrothermal vent metagenome]|uniref:Uncharacterized protein n=1 Tax=hydrothermal vent metagenome TaxID=652676 RepID=A0A3B0TZL4_9ZZZZ